MFFFIYSLFVTKKGPERDRLPCMLVDIGFLHLRNTPGRYSISLKMYLHDITHLFVSIPFSRHALVSSFRSIARLAMLRVLVPPILIVTKSRGMYCVLMPKV